MSWTMRLALFGIFGLWTYGILLLAQRHDTPRGDRDAEVSVTTPSRSTPARRTDPRDVAAAVERLRSFVVRREAIPFAPTASAKGLRRLADAIEALAGRDRPSAFTRQCDSMRAAADRLLSGRDSAAHAADARRAFIVAADVLTTLREHRLPDREGLAAPLRASARQIDGARPLLEQQEKVRRYFEESYDVVAIIAKVST